jgi:hypothetical protein
VYYEVINKNMLPNTIPFRNYEEVKASDWTPSYRYGAFLDYKTEKILVNEFREKFRGKSFRNSDLKIALRRLYAFIKGER